MKITLIFIGILFMLGCNSNNVLPRPKKGEKRYKELKLTEARKIIEKLSSSSIIKKIEAIDLDNSGKLDENDNFFIQASVVNAVDDEDLDLLKQVLQKYPPIKIGYVFLEDYLASHDLQYFQLLVDIYEKGNNTYASKVIYDALQRAFPGYNLMKEKFFVAKVNTWFKDHKKDIIVNEYYYKVSAEYSSKYSGLFYCVPEL